MNSFEQLKKERAEKAERKRLNNIARAGDYYDRQVARGNERTLIWVPAGQLDHIREYARKLRIAAGTAMAQDREDVKGG